MNDGKAFEKTCENLFEKRGYKIKTRGSRSYDGGIDIIMRHENSGEYVAVQCKCTKKQVGRPEVANLVGSIVNHNYDGIHFDRGFLVSRYGFTEEAFKYAENFNYKRDKNSLRLITFDELRNF